MPMWHMCPWGNSNTGRKRGVERGRRRKRKRERDVRRERIDGKKKGGRGRRYETGSNKRKREGQMR